MKPKLQKPGYELLESDKEGKPVQVQIEPEKSGSDAPAGVSEKKKKGKKSK